MRAALLIIVLLLGASCSARGPLVPPASSAPPGHHAVLTSGGVVEYPLADLPLPGEACVGCGRATISGMGAGPDGNVWFVDVGHRAVGRVSPSGVVTELVLPTSAGDPYWLTTGKDGNVWVTSRGGAGHQDSIARIGRGDAMTVFQAGTQPGAGFGTGPDHITAGPDGNVWFTEFWANRLGRMSPDGTLAEFSIPTPDSNPRGIVTGPDGNLWFVESRLNNSAIGRMSMKGVFTEFPLGGTSNDQLGAYDIVTGPDGNLWFDQTHPSAAQGEIGRITPSGAIRLFLLPAGGRPNGLVAGPDGNVWFTDAGANAVGRISPLGVIHEFALPRRSSTPAAMATGADGRIWFAASGRIASIGVTVPEAKLSGRILTFGSTASPHGVDITNIGEAPLKISSLSVIGADRAMFTAIRDGCTGRSIAVSSSCHVELAFAPGSEHGVLAAQLAITDNATASPQIVSLLAQLPDCRLPLFVSSTSSPSPQGEFLSLRSGALVEDPQGRFATSGTQSKSEAGPVLNGQLPATYDWAAGRWVPGVDTDVSPDGSRYAYIDDIAPMNGRLHVVVVATGADRVLPMPAGSWGLVGFTSDGIYLHANYESSGPGVTLINPDSGKVRTIASASVVYRVSGQVLWSASWNGSDTLPQPPGEGGADNEILSRDLSTSRTTSWVYRPGSSLYLLGASSGSIVVQGYDAASDFLLVATAPGQAQMVTHPGSGETLHLDRGLVADGKGWWMGGEDGLYLWTARTGAVLVSEVTAAPAGACA